MPEVVLTLRAAMDLQEIHAALDEKNAGTGDRFATELDRAIELLKQHPLMCPVYEPPARRLLVWRCRYGVIYVPEPRGIIVLAVASLGQNPDTLRRQIRKTLHLPEHE